MLNSQWVVFVWFLPFVHAVDVTVGWNDEHQLLHTDSSFQVVSHALLARSSPVYQRAFDNLRALGARRVRYVPWLPLPALGVLALDPPSANLCSPSIRAQQSLPVTLSCGAGTISSVLFASYGTPEGVCGGFTRGTCHAENSSSVVHARCVGLRACTLLPAEDFGDPCFGTEKSLAVEMKCSVDGNTYWNATLPDQMMLDVWNAIDGNTSDPIPNFSTAPSWLYSAGKYSYCDDPLAVCGGYEVGHAPALNSTALGDYYGRLLSWYTKGGFVDEFGRHHSSGHFLNITTWEVFNEVDYEHGYTVQEYTRDFDAIVRGIRRWTGAEDTAFVGLNLPNIDNKEKVLSWVHYFLNTSNHAEDIRDAAALAFIGYHSYPTNGPYDPHNPSSLEKYFVYGDAFVEETSEILKLMATLSPTTRLVLDECGTTSVLPNRNDPSSNPKYWLASGGLYAYLWAKIALVGGAKVDVVSMSQFMDDPTREPGVTMLDWRTGEGLARYFVLKLLLESFTPHEDSFAPTNSTSAVFAQGFVNNAGASKEVLTMPRYKLLLINKKNAKQHVVFNAPTRVSLCRALVVNASAPAVPSACTAQLPGSVSLLLPPFATAVVSFS